jgi:uncharacterized protein YdhG (YjbR/CyaY superfamily)
MTCVTEPVRDVGGGRLVATVSDPGGNVLGLLRDRRRFAMAETRATEKGRAQQSTKGAATKSSGFSAEERAAMKERAQELKAEARRGGRGGKADGESDVLAKIAEMPKPDRGMAERLHALIKEAAPALSPKTWYGMPAYANKEGKVVCFFRNAAKFKERYAMFGFNDSANLDDGNMWPIAFALKELAPAEEKRIVALVKKAVS